MKFLLMAFTVFVSSTIFAYSSEDVNISENSAGTKLGILKIGENRVNNLYTFLEVPDILKGLPTVIPNRGKYSDVGMEYDFKVDKPVIVYLFVDKRLAAPEGWKKTELRAKWEIKSKSYYDHIYTKEFPSGVIKIPSTKAKYPPSLALIKVK